jgi:hypothetical protein
MYRCTHGRSRCDILSCNEGKIMNMQKGNLENEHKIEGFNPCHCLNIDISKVQFIRQCWMSSFKKTSRCGGGVGWVGVWWGGGGGGGGGGRGGGGGGAAGAPECTCKYSFFLIDCAFIDWMILKMIFLKWMDFKVAQN